jgi:hypothetical protein
MKTDKELYRIFEVVPEWVFELVGLPSPGKSTLRSITVKALERRADGVIVPEAPDQPLTVVEFQFQADDTIYRRTVVEMAAVQDAFPGRVVQGFIFFGYNNLDPQTAPGPKSCGPTCCPMYSRNGSEKSRNIPWWRFSSRFWPKARRRSSGKRPDISGPSSTAR